jgi:hypothetical protein
MVIYTYHVAETDEAYRGCFFVKHLLLSR